MSPCKACHKAGADCVYVATTRVIKADLREELARLQAINSEDSALLDTILSNRTSPIELHNTLQRLLDGQPRAEVVSLLAQKSNAYGRVRKDTSSSITTPSFTRNTLPISPMAWQPDNSQSSEGSGSNGPSTIIVLPGIPTQETHFRANLVHYRSQLPQLLDIILASNCLSFCPISKNDFKRDFESGYGLYCSTALMDSLLALGTLLAKDHISLLTATVARSKPGKEDLGDAFAQEAISALYNGTGLPRRIADIQALGILSLYCLGRSKLLDGKGFAGDFGAAIIEQWRTEQPIEPDPNIFPDTQAHASIYCAAISLNRVIFLFQDYYKTLNEHSRKMGLENFHVSPQEGEMTTVQPLLDLSKSIIDDAFSSKNFKSFPDNPRVIAAKLFELTERTYKARRSSFIATFSHAVRVYQDGLRWYQSFFQYTSGCRDCNTPLIIFVHIYYQFCVLCLLTPYILQESPVAVDGTLPEAVCKQAANSIRELIKHYSQLCLDRQLLDFVPLFESAALSLLEVGDAKTSP